MPEYIKVKCGKRWLLVRPTIGGGDTSYKSIAAFDAESEIDAVLKLAEAKPSLRAVK